MRLGILSNEKESRYSKEMLIFTGATEIDSMILF
jgi:hypothetical protein